MTPPTNKEMIEVFKDSLIIQDDFKGKEKMRVKNMKEIYFTFQNLILPKL